jgi:putative NADH-flavin reductase
MNVVVLGASRGVGRCIVEHALAQGHRVTAAVRNPAVFSDRHSGLRVLTCDALDLDAVKRAVAEQDVVFSTLGADRRRAPTTLYSQAARTVAQAMRAYGVRRLIHLSNFGVLGEKARDLRTGALLFLTRHVLRHVLADHRRALDEIRQSVPEWVAIRPLPLTNGPSTRRYRIALDGLPRKGMSIARSDVADFMLKQATSDEYLYRVPAIAY